MLYCYFRSSYYHRNENSVVNQFESRMTDYLRAESTYLTNSGTDANLQSLQLLLESNPNMPVYMDKLAHATLPYATKAAGRRDIIRFKHNDVGDLARMIAMHGPGVVCVDTIYSSLGDVAPLVDIVDLCRKTGSILVADEAHALGIIGPKGAGIVPMLGLENDVPIRTASLGKTFGAGRGLVAFNKEFAYMRELVPTYAVMSIFSLAPQDCRAHRFIKTLDVVESDIGDTLRKELLDKSSYFRAGCIEHGYNGAHMYEEGPIIPFITGNIPQCKAMYNIFIKAQIFPSAFLYPLTPRNRSIIRWSMCNTVTWQDIDVTLNFLHEHKEQLKPWTWPWTMVRMVY